LRHRLRMTEITIYGRGGQGAVIASEILACAYFAEGFQVQCFPSFGVERRGAPVTAFLRISKEFIHLRSMIYQADCAIVLAPDIVHAPTFKPSVKTGASVTVNSAEIQGELLGFRFRCFDATSLALELKLGSAAMPVVNTAMLGAYARQAKDLSLDNLLTAVEEKVPQSIQKNLNAVRSAYESAADDE